MELVGKVCGISYSEYLKSRNNSSLGGTAQIPPKEAKIIKMTLHEDTLLVAGCLIDLYSDERIEDIHDVTLHFEEFVAILFHAAFFLQKKSK